MSSRILDCRDAVVTYLGTLPEAVESQAAYTVRDNAITMDGMLVRVFAAGYGDGERLARARINKDLDIVVTIEELYTEAASNDASGPVPSDWVDQRVTFVEEKIFNPLNVKGELVTDLLGQRFRIITAKVTTVYDPDRLGGSKLFWSMLELSYQEQGVTQ